MKRIFVTGASGFVGSAVVRELISAGFEVVGLARSESGASAVAAARASVFRGDLEQPETLRRAAAEADAVVHTGFVHDFSKFKACCELDREVIAVLGSALAGPHCPLIVTSAIGVLPPESVATEEARPRSPSPNPRAATEAAVTALLERGLNVSVVRLPPTTHGPGDHGFVPMLIETARKQGAAAYVDDGQNRWSAIHRDDAAAVYRLAMERNVPGRYYHAVAEEGVPFRSIAELLGRRLQVPVVSKLRRDAEAHFGWLTHFASSDIAASSLRTQAEPGFQPSRPELLADLEQSGYF